MNPLLLPVPPLPLLPHSSIPPPFMPPLPLHIPTITDAMEVPTQNLRMCTALALMVYREPEEYSNCTTNHLCNGMDCIVTLGVSPFRAHIVILVCQLPHPAVLLGVLSPNGMTLINVTVDHSEVVNFQGLLQINITLDQLLDQNAIGMQVQLLLIYFCIYRMAGKYGGN